MTIGDHVEMFGELPVRQFQAGDGLGDPERYAWRISLDYDEVEDGKTFEEVFGQFAETDGADRVEALIIGAWGNVWEGDNSAGVVRQLAMAAPRLKALRALFIGEMTFEECEISWIQQEDMSPLWLAYPQLETLRIRGAEGLSLGVPVHANLRSLAVECGGLPASVLAEVASAQLPELEHLELWLGDSGYGWDGSVHDLEPILAGRLFPKLRYLGLRDSEIADEIAAALAGSSVLRQIEVLDLSLGTFGDAGADALAADPAARQLKILDVSHNYLTDEGLARLNALGIMVRADDREEDDLDERYVAVGE